MYASPTLKHWMHHLHDSGVRVAHCTGHVLHEKSFWAIVAIVMLLAGMFFLILHFGNTSTLQKPSIPMPYTPYY